MFTPTIRVVKFALQDFFRNFWLSLVTLTILILALLSVNLLIIFNLVATAAIDSVEDKININVYFKPEIKEDQIQNVQRYLQSLMNVKAVDYISREQALENFKIKYNDNVKIMETLVEIDDNPLGASLIIKAKTTEDYPVILANLEDPQYNNLIESKDFEDHRLFIAKITNITTKVNVAVVVVALIFTLISILIILNAIKMAIYTHRDEIVAMKLVGATNWFVRAPFLFQGIIFGLLSVLVTIILVYPLLGLMQPYVIAETNFNIISYFNHNFIIIFGLEFIGAIIINLLSSYWSVNKYLNV
jgi:cell division transport system permease protein